MTATAFSPIPAGPAYAGTHDAAALVGLKALGYVLVVTLLGLVISLTHHAGIARLRRSFASEAEAPPAKAPA